MRNLLDARLRHDAAALLLEVVLGAAQHHRQVAGLAQRLGLRLRQHGVVETRLRIHSEAYQEAMHCAADGLENQLVRVVLKDLWCCELPHEHSTRNAVDLGQERRQRGGLANRRGIIDRRQQTGDARLHVERAVRSPPLCRKCRLAAVRVTEHEQVVIVTITAQLTHGAKV